MLPGANLVRSFPDTPVNMLLRILLQLKCNFRSDLLCFLLSPKCIVSCCTSIRVRIAMRSLRDQSLATGTAICLLCLCRVICTSRILQGWALSIPMSFMK